MINFLERCRVNGVAPNDNNAFPLLYGTATAASVVHSLAGVTNKCWCVGKFGLLFSYAGGTFSSGTIRFETSPDGAAWTTRLELDVAAAGLGPVPFPVPMKFALGEHVRITLTSGGASVVGKLILAHYWSESVDDPVA
jgi:hypothetical protein